MFKKALVALAFICATASGAFAQTSSEAVIGFRLMPGDTYDGYTCPASNVGPCFVQYGSSIPTSGGGGGGSDVNLTEVDSEPVDIGTGAAGLGTQRVTTSTDSTIGTVTAVTDITNPVTVTDGAGALNVIIDSGTTAVTNDGTFATQNTPQTSATTGVAATHIVTAALAANLVVKASAGNLYGFNVSADSTLSGAAWWLIAYDATSAPADGAVTPALCYAVPSGTTSINGTLNVPVAFATGITLGVSTTGCFTKTASTHAFIAADYK